MSSPDPPASRLCRRLFRQHVVADDIVSAVTERGSYPFPFRTRKSSPSSPMVPGLRARESRSPLDSRGPPPNRQGASSFLQTARPLCMQVPVAGPRSRRHGLSVQAACGSRPLAANARGGFFMPGSPARVMLTKVSIGFSCQRHPEPVSGAASCVCTVVFSWIARGLRGLAPRREGTASHGDGLSAKQTLEAAGRIPVCVRSGPSCGWK